MGIGARLAELRESRGLTSAALAARTRIAPTILRAIERDDFQQVPSGIFARGYLRAYARELGLDPEEVIAAFVAEQAPNVTTSPAPPLNSSLLEEVSRVRQPLTEVALVAGALLVAAAALYWWPAGDRAAPARASDIQASHGATAADVDVRPARGSSRNPRPLETGDGRPAVEGRDQVEVTLAAERTVWVSAAADGQRVVYRLLVPEEQVSLTAAHRVDLRVGDAGALLVGVNGSRPLPAGGPGEVRNLIITREGRDTSGP
jgi:cytoskeletal protein RodZ